MVIALQLAGSPIEVPPPARPPLAMRFNCALDGDTGRFVVRGTAREDRWQKVTIAIESDDPRFPALTGQASRLGDILYLLDERRWGEGERIAYRLLPPGIERNGVLVVSSRRNDNDADQFVATGLCDVVPVEKVQ